MPPRIGCWPVNRVSRRSWLSNTWQKARRRSTTSPLVTFGHSRDGKRGKPIVVYGVITDRLGRPVAVEVYPGNTADPSTVSDQVGKLKRRFKSATGLTVIEYLRNIRKEQAKRLLESRARAADDLSA